MMTNDDGRTAHESLEAILRRLHDADDVLAAISAAARLLETQLQLAELDAIRLAKLAADKGN
jgi:hypothetical protein